MRARRHALVCPHCSHPFERRLNLVGSTRCPACKEKFLRRANLSDIGHQQALQEERRVAEAKARAVVMGTVSPRGIRGRQVPSSMSEARFKGMAVQRRWTVHRPSWPDFLVRLETGETVGVEVKRGTDPLTSEQHQTALLLESLGIKIYVWRDARATRHRLSRYRPRHAAPPPQGALRLEGGPDGPQSSPASVTGNVHCPGAAQESC